MVSFLFLKNNIKKYEKVLTLKNKYDNILFSFWLEKSNKNYNYISSKIDKNKKNKKNCWQRKKDVV